MFWCLPFFHSQLTDSIKGQFIWFVSYKLFTTCYSLSFFFSLLFLLYLSLLQQLLSLQFKRSWLLLRKRTSEIEKHLWKYFLFGILMNKWLRMMCLNYRYSLLSSLFEMSLPILLLYFFIIFKRSLQNLLYFFRVEIFRCNLFLFWGYQVSYFR